jgi:branched-chain amino acid transport system ATP-binding protein
MLEVRGVAKAFGGVAAVRDVDMSVGEREIVALLGPNGAGKTTLFNLIAGALPCDRGEVRFQGERVSGLGAAAICRRGLARTFQIPQVFGSMTVLEATMVGAFLRHRAIPVARDAALAVLERVGLSASAGALTTTLTISGKKRLEIARALATAPRLVLLDEVLAGLNGPEVSRLLEVIRGIREHGTAVLLVEHNMEAVMSVSDRVVVLDQGRKLAEGAPAEIVHHPEVIRAYLGSDHAAA